MKFGTIGLLLSVFMLTQSVFGTITNCQRKNRVLKRRITCLYHKNKGLLSMLEDLKDTLCSYGNNAYYEGQTFPEDCNTCVCEKGIVSCTSGPCNQSCEYDELTYSHGDTFPSIGGCYQCICGNGNVDCSTKICETRPTIKQATQSSDAKNLRPAGNAIAKDLNLVAVTSYPPTETGNPWWMLEYHCEQTITGVTIYNRIDSGAAQINNLTISIDGQECGRIGNPTVSSGGSITLMCNEPLTGTNLTIAKEVYEVLGLAEVEPIISCSYQCN